MGVDTETVIGTEVCACHNSYITPDPNGGIELPPHLIGDVVGKEVGFNISRIRRGHPMLKLGDLSVEASQSLR
ncbi:Pseudomonalisin [Bienertia sinuspersici]